jgi:LuxR family transcriptional regulator, maltose regulon positive regulatory protein
VLPPVESAPSEFGYERVPGTQRTVPRAGLFNLLSAAGPGDVVLVCAPAGSGKTVVLRSWIESEGLSSRVAWVSVERGEGDAQHFWRAVVDALAAAAGEEELVERVGATPGFRGDAMVESLLLDLRSLAEPEVLVVDDLHELRSQEALRLLERFLEQVPARLEVVLATRKEPELGLHRLRLSGGLTEIRDHDLRFTLDETRQLLEADGTTLSDAAVERLHERTEGWVAGLRMAALSLARHPNPECFVSEFSGSERTVAGYLLAEVLERQPAEVRELLLRTSVLERVSGPLADFLTGGTGSERILQQLEDANAFVVSLDARRSWFRYHQLFAELLRLELRRTAPELVGSLHRAAAQWYEERGFVVDEIRHAEACGDWAHAARALADNAISLVFDGRAGTLRALLAAIPRSAADDDGELALAFAKAALSDGRLDESATCVAAAERLAETVAPTRRRRFDVQLAEVTISLARRRGDLATAKGAMRSLEEGLAAQPASELALGNDLQAAALMNLGIAELWSSRVVDARGHLEQGLELARRIGRPYLEVGCLGHLAIVAPFLELPASRALDLSEQAIAIAEEHGWSDDPVIAAGLATRGVTLAWLGRFDDAQGQLEQARRAIAHDGEPGTELIIDHASGLLSMARGRFDDALAAFEAAERMQTLLASEHAMNAERCSRIVEILVWTGDSAGGRAALAALGGQQHDVAGARIAEAAVQISEGEPQLAIQTLAPVVERRERAIKASWAAIDGSLLEALAHDQLGDSRSAEASIERALELAEPEGVMLPFAIFPVRELLERHPRHQTAHATLLSEILLVLDGASARHGTAPAPLHDALSEAELRVVRYLPSNLKAPEIASELYVSANTVRTHLRHIYAKLDAHSRAEAVERARQLGLLAPGRY